MPSIDKDCNYVVSSRSFKTFNVSTKVESENNTHMILPRFNRTWDIT